LDSQGGKLPTVTINNQPGKGSKTMGKKATIIDSCDRCGKTIVIEQERSRPAVDVSNDLYLPCESEYVRKRYLTSIEINGSRSVKIDHTDYLLFCRDCDGKYWENFKAANKMLAEFWEEAQEKTDG
jgi:hypothetical protein